MTILSFLLPLSLAAAANPTCEVADTTIILDEAVVTGLTGLTKMKESPLPTIYVSENTFKSLSGTNVMDKLARFPGVSQITTGGGISKPVVRGLGYNRVVTTDDGVRQEGQQWGDEHGLEIDDSKISSVEILKGPASLMYGSDAIGGVVIIKSNPTLPTGTRMARWASEYQSNNGLLGTSLFAGGNEDGFIWDGHASIKSAHSYKNDEDGYVPNTQFTQKALDGMVGLSRAWGHSWLKASWFNLKPTMTEEDEGNSLSYNHGYPYQDVSHLKVTSDNSFVAGNGRIIAILAYQMNTRKEFEEGTEPGIHMNLGTLSYDLKYATSESARVRMNYGLNGMYQTNENKGEEALIPDYGLFDAGAFGTASGDFGRWHLSGGLRLDYRHVSTKKVDDKFTEFNKDFSSISASFGAVYDINENMLVKANVARGFRAPNISELGSDGEHEGTFRYELGNTDLNPEHSLQADLSYQVTLERFSLEVEGFANRIEDYIFLERNGSYSSEGTPVYTFKQGDALLAGAEISAEWHPVDPLHLGSSYSYIRTKQLHTSYCLPLTPAPKWISEAKYTFDRLGCRFVQNIDAALMYEYHFKQDRFYGVNDTETPTSAYGLVNASLNANVGKVFLSLYCNNILDKAYTDHLSRLKYAGFRNMGRNFGIKAVIEL